MFNFEKLEVWHKAIAFADAVYATTRSFPADERFGLTNEMRRAAISISSNIAEGSARLSRKDFARFLEIATGSVFEVISQLFIGRNQNFWLIMTLPCSTVPQRNWARGSAACGDRLSRSRVSGYQLSTLNHQL